MVRNDYYNMSIDDVRVSIDVCEKSGVSSVAIEGYEWLLHQWEIAKSKYIRLMELYRLNDDFCNFRRVKERYDAIYNNN